MLVTNWIKCEIKLLRWMLYIFAIMLTVGCDMSGSGARYFLGGPYGGTDPCFSPDGSKIVFGSLRYWFSLGDICVINSDGSNWNRLTNTWAYEGEPNCSPDGLKIVFVSERNGNGEIYIMDSNGSHQKRLTNNEFYDSSPSFSPDGSKIVFTRQMHRLPDYWGYTEIFIMNVDGTGEKRLTHNDVADVSPSFSPDGKNILYAVNENKFEIWIMNSNGSNSMKLLENGSQPSFSADGKKIVFISDKSIQFEYEVYIMNVDGTEPKQITYTKAYNIYPTFSPDGLKILFFSIKDPNERSRGRGDICVMNIDGSNLTVISKNY